MVGTYVAPYKLPELEAMNGNWNSTNTGSNILIVPDQSAAKNDFMLTIPMLSSFIGGDFSGNSPDPRLKLTPSALRPLMLATFYGFRSMYFAWMAMFAVALTGLVLRLRSRLYTARWFHRILFVMTPAGIVAIWGGWITAESGRQPWIVYGQLLTADAVSPLRTWPVLASLIGFVTIYLTLLGTFVWYVARVVRQGPDYEAESGSGPEAPTLPPAPELRPATAGGVSTVEVGR